MWFRLNAAVHGHTRFLGLSGEPTMVMMRAGALTVRVYLHADTAGGSTEQRVQVKDGGYLVYDGTDLSRAQLEAESAGLPWADLELIDDGGAAAAG